MKVVSERNSSAKKAILNYSLLNNSNFNGNNISLIEVELISIPSVVLGFDLNK